MYPVELDINDKTESNSSASYLDLLLWIGLDGQLHTSIYDATMSSSTSQTSRSWVETFTIRRPKAFSSHNS